MYKYMSMKYVVENYVLCTRCLMRQSPVSYKIKLNAWHLYHE